MLALTVFAVASSADGGNADPDYRHYITYHSNYPTGGDVSVTVAYDGIAATEYNPLYWKGTFTDTDGRDAANWSAPTGTHPNANVNVSMVFAGWFEKTGSITKPSSTSAIDPGDVVDKSVTDLYAFWVYPNLFSGNAQYAAKGTSVSVTSGEKYSDNVAVRAMYLNQFYITGSITGDLAVGSYRSQSIYTGSGSLATMTIGGQIKCTGDVVIDNLILKSGAAGDNHGYGTSRGIWACSHRLIMGAGIDSSGFTSMMAAPQVFGGYPSTATDTAVCSNKSVVSNDDRLNGMAFNMGSFVIIHSGTYYAVSAAGHANFGSSDTPLSSYLVFKKAIVLDSVSGGIANSSSSSVMYSSKTSQTQYDPYQGGSFIYAIGLTGLSDTWAANTTGYDSYGATSDEGAVITGGCSCGRLDGSSHVFVSGNSSVWDVQGGSRLGGNSTTGTSGGAFTAYTYLEISGSAEVRHAACGTVTDGVGSNYTCAYNSHVRVMDNAMVAMVFGAGYDTWENPTGTNMANGKSITVEITGGTIGFVYGGGYRGTIGTTGKDIEVNVSVTGGTVKYDVFGGGRGGLDKMLRSTSGSEPGGSGYKNSSGSSIVYGHTNVLIGGKAVIEGNVYGGGESVPLLSRYYGITSFSNNNTSVQVARVVGETSVTVSDSATVLGSVYGAGKGISLNGDTVDGTYYAVSGETVADYYTKNIVIKKTGDQRSFYFLDWYNHSSESGGVTYVTNTNTYKEYANTSEDAGVTINGGAISGSVYGGGAKSKVYGDTSATLTAGTVVTDVYGGGLGYYREQSVAGDSTVSISQSNGSVSIGKWVYGGASFGVVNGDTVVTINGGTVGEDVFGSGKGALGIDSTGGNSRVIIQSGTVAGNIYGGAENGIVKGTANVTINNGIIGNDVFGAGKGDLDIVSVEGNTTLNINGGQINDNVYAGSENGIVNGDLVTTVNGGTVDGSLYGGGLGQQGHQSTCKTRNVFINGGSIGGSVFGGSSNGDDYLENDAEYDTSGSVTGSMGSLDIPEGYDYTAHLTFNNVLVTKNGGYSTPEIAFAVYDKLTSNAYPAVTVSNIGNYISIENKTISYDGDSYSITCDVVISSTLYSQRINDTNNTLSSLSGYFILFTAKIADYDANVSLGMIKLCPYEVNTTIDSVSVPYSNSTTPSAEQHIVYGSKTTITTLTFDNMGGGAQSSRYRDVNALTAQWYSSSSSSPTTINITTSSRYISYSNYNRNEGGTTGAYTYKPTLTLTIQSSFFTQYPSTDGWHLDIQLSIKQRNGSGTISSGWLRLSSVEQEGSVSVTESTTDLTIQGNVPSQLNISYLNIAPVIVGASPSATIYSTIYSKDGTILKSNPAGISGASSVTRVNNNYRVVFSSLTISSGFYDQTVGGKPLSDYSGYYLVIRCQLTGTASLTVGEIRIFPVTSGYIDSDSHVVVDGGDVTHSVYGGGGLNVTKGNTSVLINSGFVGESVYGGGLGTVGEESVSGNASVDIITANIMGSVYGGAENGIVGQASSVKISNGHIYGSVYGAGLGAAGTISVTEGASVSISGGQIDDSVYGGAENGIVSGDTAVTVTGGTLNNSVYSGGKGVIDNVAVEGNKIVIVNNATVNGSVYGGSAYGNDYPAGDGRATSTVVVGPAGDGTTVIGGSVFGSGFMGNAKANTYVYVGYSAKDVASIGGSLEIGQSIYGGGDVGDVDDGSAFIISTLDGDSNVYINGNIDLSFAGSILGSGNSCLIDGTSTITVDSLNLDNEILAIHRANNVYLKSCNLTLRGMSNGTFDNAPYSIYGVDNLYLMGETSLLTYSSMGEIGALYSQTLSGINTMASSPGNKIYSVNGTTLIIRKGSSYGKVTGYIILSLVDARSHFGAFAFGSSESPGGFVIEHGGNYQVAETQKLGDDCRCWYISGITNVASSVSLIYDPDSDTANVGSEVSIPLLGTDWDLKYSGSAFFSNLTGTYDIVQRSTGMTHVDDAGHTWYDYSVKLGTSGNVLFGAGAYIRDSMVDGSFESTDHSVRPGTLGFTVCGPSLAQTFDVGSVAIYLQEVTKIPYYLAGDPEVHYEDVVCHTIILTVEISNVSNTLPDDATITIETVLGSGDASYIISPGFVDGTVEFMGASQYVDGKVSLSAAYNNGNTLGWAKTSSSKINQLVAGDEIGRLNGGYPATIKVEVTDWEGDFSVDLSFRFKHGSTTVYFTVTVVITERDMVSVTFHDNETKTTITKRFPYGSIISESETPATTANFIGWYYDTGFLNEYTYTNPIIHNMDLYARYLYQVTFDEQNGSTSTTYVRMILEGSRVTPPEDPVREGYTFDSWYVKEGNGERVWNFETDVIKGSTTFYARWIGDNTPVMFRFEAHIGQVWYSGFYLEGSNGNVTFFKEGRNDGTDYRFVIGNTAYNAEARFSLSGYLLMMDGSVTGGNGIQYSNSLQVAIGSGYGDVINRAASSVETYLSSMDVSDNIRWTIGTTVVRDSTSADVAHMGSGYITLQATVPITSAEVILNANNNYASVLEPSDFFVAENEHNYTFIPVGAVSTNGMVITGWSTNSRYSTEGTGLYLAVGSQWVVPSDSPYFVDAGGVKTLNLYAVWKYIDYTVKISNPVGGRINAYLNGTAPGTEFEGLHYGVDSIVLRFDPDSGYSLGGWQVYGEGEVRQDGSGNYYLDVIGNCTISAYASSLSTAYIDLYIRGEHDLSVYNDLAFHLYAGGNKYLTITSMQDMGEYVTFSAPCGIGEYELYAESAGVLYRVYDPDTGSPVVVNVYKDQEGEEQVHATAVLYAITNNIGTNGSPDVPGEARITGLPLAISAAPLNASYTLTVGEHYNVIEDIKVGNVMVIAIGSKIGEFTVDGSSHDGIVVTGTIETVKQKITVYALDVPYHDKEGNPGIGTFTLSASEVYVYYGSVLDGKLPIIYDSASKAVGFNDDFEANKDWMIIGWYPNSDYVQEIDIAADQVTEDMDIYAEIIYNTYVKYFLQTYTESVVHHGTEDMTERARYYRVPYNADPRDHEPVYQAEANTPEGYYYDDEKYSCQWNNVLGTWLMQIHYSLKTAADPKFDLSDDYTAEKSVRDGLVNGWETSDDIRYLVPSEGTVVYYKDYIRLPELVQEGYSFKGWRIDGNLYPAGTFQVTSLVDSVDKKKGVSFLATAEFEKEIYTITFDPVRFSMPGVTTVYYAEYDSDRTVGNIVLTDLIQDMWDQLDSVDHKGYTLGDWVYSTPLNEGKMPASNIILSATWTPVKVSVTYDESDAHSSISVTVGSTELSPGTTGDIEYNSKLTATILVDYGYRLTDACDSALSALDGTNLSVVKEEVTVQGTQYTRVLVTMNVGETDLTIPVQTVVKTYTVNFVSNEPAWGKVSLSTLTVAYNTLIAVSGNVVTLAGSTVTATPTPNDSYSQFAFEQWSVSDGARVTKDLTVTAVFSTSTKEYVINFDGEKVSATVNGTPISSGDSVTYGTRVTVTLVDDSGIGISPMPRTPGVESTIRPLPYAGNGQFTYTAIYPVANFTPIYADVRGSVEGLDWAVSASYGYMVFTTTQQSAAIPDFDSFTAVPWYPYYKFLKYVSIRENVTYIGAHAFDSCEALASIEATSSLTHVGDYAFINCTGLTSIAVPNNITLGIAAFANCSSITTLNIGYGVTLSDYAFQGCTSIQTVTAYPVGLPAYAFQGCTSLRIFEIVNGSIDISAIGHDAFGGCTLTIKAGANTYEIDDSYSDDGRDVPDIDNTTVPGNNVNTNSVGETGETGNDVGQPSGAPVAVAAGTDSGAQVTVPTAQTFIDEPVTETISAPADEDISQYVSYVKKKPVPEAAETVIDAVPETVAPLTADGMTVVEPQAQEQGSADAGMPAGLIAVIMAAVIASLAAVLILRRH